MKNFLIALLVIVVTGGSVGLGFGYILLHCGK
jgi:hypothetical protein